MRNLVDENSDHGDDADLFSSNKRSSNSKTIGEVVHEVSNQVKVSGNLKTGSLQSSFMLMMIMFIFFFFVVRILGLLLLLLFGLLGWAMRVAMSFISSNNTDELLNGKEDKETSLKCYKYSMLNTIMFFCYF